MNKNFKKLSVGAATLALATAGFGPATTPALAMECGFQVLGHDYWYNHCGTGNVQVQVDRLIGNEEACFGPGATPVSRTLNRPTNVFADGSC